MGQINITNIWHSLKPAMMMMLVRTVFSIVNILYKLATLDGMSQRIIVAYRFMLGASVMIPLALIFERKRPNLSWMVLVQAFFCGLFGGSLLHNMYIESLTLTSPTFVSATNNLVPAITFIMAITIGVEKLACETMAGKAKVLGTLIAIGGAMVLTFYKGVQINMKPTHVDLLRHGQNGSNSTHQSTTAHHLLGALLALCSSTSNAIWLNIQAKMSEKYPCAYSSTALTCTMAAIQSTVFALCMEKDMSRWKLGWNIRLLTVAVSGILASGLMFSVVFWVVSIRGPLYASVFNPLTLVLTAFGSFLFLQEKLYLGSIIGALLIVTGVYLVLWGKGKEMKKKKKKEEEEDQKAAQVTPPAITPLQNQTLEIIQQDENNTSDKNH